MKNFYALLIFALTTLGMQAQYPYLQVTDLLDPTPADLANCNDTSSYFQDTVTIVCYVVTDGNLCEVSSSSINGANGIRPFIWVNDTANGGAVGPNTGLQVMGVNWGTSQATSGFTSLISGDLIEITGVLGMYNNNSQFQPLNNNAITILTSTFPTFTPVKKTVGDFNDAQQVNNLVTGEPYAGAFVRLDSVTVTNVSNFGSGTGARVSFTVADKDGNTMDIADIFVAQRLPTWSTLNPNSPYSAGLFANTPSQGTFFTSITGVVEHSGNGCTGGTGFGYRLHPFDTSHYQVGSAVPSISNVVINPSVPTSSDPIVISADIADPDGSVDTAEIYWSNDTSLPIGAYTKANMTISSGSTYSYTIQAQANNSIISFYIRAVDNEGGEVFYPASAGNVARVYVRNDGLTIMDIQTPIDGSGASPFAGQSVSVKGYVSAATRDCDLGYVYIQDTTATEYAGLALRGSLNLANLYRNEYVKASGVIQESFGFTTMLIDSIRSLGSGHEVKPVDLDPGTVADPMEQEKYESMLVRYKASGGGPLYITNPNLGFGEYAVSSNQNPPGNSETRRVLAGRQSGTSAQSSLHVQLVSDTTYQNQDGVMAFTAIATAMGMTMDAMTGVLYYSFSNFKLTPRNNWDIENLSVALDTNCTFPTINILEIGNNLHFEIYPNPASEVIFIEGNGENLNVKVFDLSGTLIMERNHNEAGALEMSIEGLNRGMYLIQITEGDWNTASYKVMINK